MVDELRHGRDCYDRREWGEAYQALAAADRACPLGAEDLERLATAAYLAGDEDQLLEALDRAHHAHLQAGEGGRAARGAFWLGLRLLLRGETARATGWLARAHRLVEREGRACVEQGYLGLPIAEQKLGRGEHEAAQAVAASATEIGERFGDTDLTACGRHVQGRALIQAGKVAEGLALLDEAMIAVTSGELSPMMTGLIYCSVIDACRQVHALGRAREWTDAMAGWCQQQPQLVAFTGVCLVHRAEIMQLNGSWEEAFEQARAACARASQRPDQRPPAAAFYQQGELYRLRGELAKAEEVYRRASLAGCEPQPGLALLRLAQGKTEAAVAAMRRVVAATTEPLERTRLLPAHVEVLLAAGVVEEARRACGELEELAAHFETDVLRALAAQARGAVALAAGEAEDALGPLRLAGRIWEQVQAPYLAARVRELVGLCCRALDDRDGARLEEAAARATFAALGAAPDLARIDAQAHRSPPGRRAHGLTPRELQVLALVATGKSNKELAAELGLSEKTIERHISNIFHKLEVSSRAAATAYAYQKQLV